MLLSIILTVSLLVFADGQGTKGGSRYRPLPSIPKPSFFGTKSSQAGAGAEDRPDFVEPPPAPAPEPDGDGPVFNGPPMPYAFSYATDGHDGRSAREETSDGTMVRGSYMLEGADGINRMVYYVADKDGFRATVMTNEPGTESQNPAAVKMMSSQPPAEEIALKYGPREPARNVLSQPNYIGSGAGNVQSVVEAGFDDEGAQAQLRDEEPEQRPSWQQKLKDDRQSSSSAGTKTLQRPDANEEQAIKRPPPPAKRPLPQRRPTLPPPPPPPRKIPQASVQLPAQRPLDTGKWRPMPARIPQASIQRLPAKLPPRLSPSPSKLPARGKIGAATQDARPFFQRLAPRPTAPPQFFDQQQEKTDYLDEPQQQRQEKLPLDTQLPDDSQQQLQLKEEPQQQIQDQEEDASQQQQQLQLDDASLQQQQQQQQYSGFF